MLDASITSGRVGGSRGGQRKAWQKAHALAGMRDQGWGWDSFLDTGPTGKSQVQMKKGEGECDTVYQGRTQNLREGRSQVFVAVL